MQRSSTGTTRDVQLEIDANSAKPEIVILSTKDRLDADLYLYGVGFVVLEFLLGSRNDMYSIAVVVIRRMKAPTISLFCVSWQ